jgi:thiamine-monophosphate kinase
MDERAALALVGDVVTAASDDAAYVDGQVLTIDMLHESTDLPPGTTAYTTGWRAVGVSLSDVGAMGATAGGVVAAYGAPSFDEQALSDFLAGATDVCDAVGAEYVGGDLDSHDEPTVATAAVGHTEDPVYRSGASPGDALCVTGTLGRTAAAMRAFETGEVERANELFQFTPRVASGAGLAGVATAMMDSSDGLARSLHQLAAASECGFAVESGAVPVDPAVEAVAASRTERREMALFFGEDFELVFTVPPDEVAAAEAAADVPVHVVGEVTDGGVTIDGTQLPDRGYTHGEP